MPRTKVAKSAAKREREEEDLVEITLKNFETRVNFIYQDIEYRYMDQYAKLDEELETFVKSIPPEVAKMKIGDFKRLALPTFDEVAKHVQAEMTLNHTMQLDRSIRDEGKESLTPLTGHRIHDKHSLTCTLGTD